jgi:hypothetical protein
MSRMVSNLRGKLAVRGDIPSVHTDALLYCPDYTVVNPETAGLVPERIVDARRRDRLCAVIQQLLPVREETPATAKVHAFLRDLIQLDTDVSALMGHARTMVTRISGGLAHWARQLDFVPFRLRVTGTAGSGKTQLALAEYRATLDAGRRPLYVCFNRPLADHFNRIAPPGGLACTIHQLCDQRVRHAGEVPDFTLPDAFERLQRRAEELPVDESFLFDTIIVDEGQDFSERWRDFAFAHARPDARFLWLEDPMQNLYGREPAPLPGWVTLHAPSNYRSPRPVVEMLRRLLPGELDIEAASPIAADEISIHTYADTPGLIAKVKEAIRDCYSAGFKKHDVAIVSYHGREHSQLMPFDRLGMTTLRRFTGDYDLFGQPVFSEGDVLLESVYRFKGQDYDLFGQPVFSEGDVLLESVYRFKGQAAPAVIFAEIDFDELDDKAVRKIFVGATRSMMRLTLILHENSAKHLIARIQPE